MSHGRKGYENHGLDEFESDEDDEDDEEEADE